MTLVHTDDRRRVSLGKLLEANRDYRVSRSPHGTVVLEPVTTISDYERALLSNHQAVEQLEAAAGDLERGAVRTRTRRSRSEEGSAAV
ncbi:hypothetical protein [Clavibacter californiensis]|uniref:Uncharacterized protein n=1 Tax=Clavibacter californiensis TaxID=1401995 RepID=A0ABX9NCK6_9MICO|nr:hypothetical protein [Clavibacter californiensis]RII94880.1 hypothetical protein DZF98_00210 [Clavibacter californiensis]UKF81708.1 hypothetical protein FGD68_15205 [Clavibacter californiensis]